MTLTLLDIVCKVQIEIWDEVGDKIEDLLEIALTD